MQGPGMTPELIARYDQRVPRYTSYPTAPHFRPDVTAETYASWLGELAQDKPLSLYLHVPFCAELCLYCGCNTAVTRSYKAVASYVECLEREIGLVAQNLPGRMAVSHIHWGGGTPTILSPDDLRRISWHLGAAFAILPDAEIAVEIDPRTITPEHVKALAASGLNLLSPDSSQREAEDRSLAPVRLGPDLSAMSLDDRPADRQAHPHPMLLRGYEGLKKLSRHFGGKSRPRILDTQLDMGVVDEPRGYLELPAGCFLHGLDGIADQVEEDLLDLDPVDENQRRIRVEIERNPDALLLGSHESQGARLFDEPLQRLDLMLASPRDTNSRSCRMTSPARRASSAASLTA